MLIPRCIALGFPLCMYVLGGSLIAPAQTQGQTPVSILAQVREATGGNAWENVAELRTEGTVLLQDKTGTVESFDDLRTGANVDRVDLQGIGQVDHHADMPVQSWAQDKAGDVLLTPGGKSPGDIDDLYIHRHGWWEPHFGGATITLLPSQTDKAITYEALEVRVPGGNGFTLWIDRTAHSIARIVRGNSTTLFSDFRRTESGLILPFREQQGTDQKAAVITTTKVTALPRLDEADFKPPFHADYEMPASGQVTVPAEGGLIFAMKINGQGPFRTVFDIGQSILGRFILTVDCMRGIMYLDKTPNSDKPEIFNRAGLVLDPADGVDRVMTVFAGSSGEASGLKPGDTITSINGKPPSDDPNDPAFNQPVGTVVHLTIKRNGVLSAHDVPLKNVL